MEAVAVEEESQVEQLLADEVEEKRAVEGGDKSGLYARVTMAPELELKPSLGSG